MCRRLLVEAEELKGCMVPVINLLPLGPNALFRTCPRLMDWTI